MSGKSNDLSFLNIIHQSKYAHYLDVYKNEEKNSLLATKSCSEICFQNLKNDYISNTENQCLNRCFKKYLDSLYIGEQIYEGLNKKTLSSAHLASGKFDQFVTDAQKALDL